MNFLHNPFFKTLASLFGGIALAAVDSAIQHPTGGLATTLNSNPYLALAFTGGALFVHNWISRQQFTPSPTVAILPGTVQVTPPSTVVVQNPASVEAVIPKT